MLILVRLFSRNDAFFKRFRPQATEQPATSRYVRRRNRGSRSEGWIREIQGLTAVDCREAGTVNNYVSRFPNEGTRRIHVILYAKSGSFARRRPSAELSQVLIAM